MRNTFRLLSGLWLGALAALPASAMPLAPSSMSDTAIVTQQRRIPAFLGLRESDGLPQPTAELWLFEEEN